MTVVVVALLIFCSPAYGKILFEPVVGQHSGDMSYIQDGLGAPLDGKFGWDLSGLVYGAHLGYFHPNVYISLNWLGGTMEQTASIYPTGGSAPAADDYRLSEFGFTVGKQLDQLKVFVNFVIQSKWTIPEDVVSSGAEQDDALVANGYSLGFGYTGIPHVHFNFELKLLDFTKAIDGPTEVETNYPLAQATQPRGTLYLLTVSFPFVFELGWFSGGGSSQGN